MEDKTYRAGDLIATYYSFAVVVHSCRPRPLPGYFDARQRIACRVLESEADIWEPYGTDKFPSLEEVQDAAEMAIRGVW